jgi:UDP-N-acetylmuramate dehydrogenase
MVGTDSRPRAEAPPLSSLTSLRVGGPPTSLLEADSLEAVCEAVAGSKKGDRPLLVLGGGSNLVVADEGVAAEVVRIRVPGWTASHDGPDVVMAVGAGLSWDETVDRWVDDGLAGCECLTGIPGTVGAVPIQNVGAYGCEVADVIEWVEVVPRRGDGSVIRVPGAACGFGYRTSRFRRHPDEAIVVRVGFRLRRGGGCVIRYRELARHLGVAVGERCDDLRAVRDAVRMLRRSKGMVLDTPEIEGVGTAGSFFVNPVVSRERLVTLGRRAVDAGFVARVEDVPHFEGSDGFKVPAAWLIERAGFDRGWRRGRVGLSPHHALAVVTHPGATCSEVVGLAQAIRGAVFDAFGVVLQPEPVFWGPVGVSDVQGGVL